MRITTTRRPHSALAKSMTPILTSNNHALNMFLSTYGGVHYQLRSFLGTVQSKLTDCIKEVLFLGGGGGGVLAVNMILNRGL